MGDAQASRKADHSEPSTKAEGVSCSGAGRYPALGPFESLGGFFMVCSKLCGQWATTGYFSPLRTRRRCSLSLMDIIQFQGLCEHLSCVWSLCKKRFSPSDAFIKGCSQFKRLEFIHLLLRTWLIPKYCGCFSFKMQIFKKRRLFLQHWKCSRCLIKCSALTGYDEIQRRRRTKLFCVCLHGREKMQLCFRRTDKELQGTGCLLLQRWRRNENL